MHKQYVCSLLLPRYASHSFRVIISFIISKQAKSAEKRNFTESEILLPVPR